jgi:cation diffusion facilitator family transporter
MIQIRKGLMASALGIAVNISLALIKVAAGVWGHSYALIADGIESSADVVSSCIVWSGLKVSVRPPDRNHPYGHGKAESLAGLVVALALLGAAALISTQSIGQIGKPHQTPAWFTLPVLLLVIVTKESLSRFVLKTASSLESGALKGDGWHHRSDALTSAAAFVGITIALIGGPGYEAADDWAALLACGVIAFNGFLLVRGSVRELMDAAPAEALQTAIRTTAQAVPGVIRVEKCLVRKYGLGYWADLHVEVDGAVSVHEGHRIAHTVKNALRDSELRILDATVHIEPAVDQCREAAPLVSQTSG